MVEILQFDSEKDLSNFTNGTSLGNVKTYDAFLAIMRGRDSKKFTGFKINGRIADRNEVETHFGVGEEGMF